MASDQLRSAIDRLQQRSAATRDALTLAAGAAVSPANGQGFRHAKGAHVLDSVTGREGVVELVWREPRSGREMYDVRFSGAADGTRRGDELEPVAGRS